MELAARTGAWSGKPLPYLRRVAYLESHGTEWIDTGITARGTLTVESDFVANSANGYLFGGRIGWLSSQLALYENYNGGILAAIHGNDYASFPKRDGVRQSVIQKPGELIVDGLLVKTWIAPTFDAHKSIYLFAENQNGKMNERGKFSLYGLIISEYGINLRSFVPVLDLSGRPCFYDEVSGQFFYNQGTGEFTPGPDVA